MSDLGNGILVFLPVALIPDKDLSRFWCFLGLLLCFLNLLELPSLNTLEKHCLSVFIEDPWTRLLLLLFTILREGG
jgi:hypothetical protein